MNIGILTYHCVPNFGAQLQVISTVGYLKRIGHNPIVLHWYPKDLEDMYLKRIPQIQILCHEKFTNDTLPVTNICRTEDELLKEILSNRIDGIICGSDALFKYIPIKRRAYFSRRQLHYVSRKVLSVESLAGNPFFGDFISRLPKRMSVVAFSVSSQNCPFDVMNEDEKNEMKSYLTYFSAITVRDQWTKEMVERITDFKDVQITPDPVFSFNQNVYFQLPSKERLQKKYGLHDDYILVSFGKRFIKKHEISDIGKELKYRGVQSVCFPMPEGLNNVGLDKEIELPLTPIEWYALIIYSKGYIGERMHPIVVSIHNSIPFFVFDEYGIISRTCFGFIKKHNLESSKTYGIVEKAGLLDYYYSYHQGKPLPQAKTVVERLLSFDKKKCSQFAARYQKYYEQSMDSILDFFGL